MYKSGADDSQIAIQWASKSVSSCDGPFLRSLKSCRQQRTSSSAGSAGSARRSTIRCRHGVLMSR